MENLDFSGREQLYYQLYNVLFQRITDGTYRTGERIPSESELMQTFHVSRMTARKSMEMLANDGLVLKKRGYGTVVISSHPTSSPHKVVRYAKKNRDGETTAYKKMIDLCVIPAPEEIRRSLRLAENTEVVRLKRVRYGEKEPLYLEINYFEKAFVPDLVNRDFSRESLRAFLSTNYSIQWSYASQEIFSVLSDDKQAELLKVEKGSPLLYIKRISYDIQKKPREYVATYYLGDKYRIEMELGV